jgi:gliding motility-associated lipoprotein GldH
MISYFNKIHNYFQISALNVIQISCLCIILVFGFSSCGKGTIFDKNQTISGESWKRTDVVKFEVPVTDTLTPVDFFLNVRNSTDYRFSNLYLFITTIFPDKKFARDTVECILSSPDGKWLGKGISKLKENNILLKKLIRFPKKGMYRFEIEQGMRVESLEGITDIGIRIQKH